MKTEINILKERYLRANTVHEYEAIRKEMQSLCDENSAAVAEAALESIKETNAKLLREQLKDDMRLCG